MCFGNIVININTTKVIVNYDSLLHVDYSLYSQREFNRVWANVFKENERTLRSVCFSDILKGLHKLFHKLVLESNYETDVYSTTWTEPQFLL